MISVAGMARKLSDLWPVHCPLRVLSPWIFQVVFQKLVLMHTAFKSKVLKKRFPLVGMIRWYFSLRSADVGVQWDWRFWSHTVWVSGPACWAKGMAVQVVGMSDWKGHRCVCCLTEVGREYDWTVHWKVVCVTSVVYVCVCGGGEACTWMYASTHTHTHTHTHIHTHRFNLLDETTIGGKTVTVWQLKA